MTNRVPKQAARAQAVQPVRDPYDVLAAMAARGAVQPMLTGLEVVDDAIGDWLVPGGMVTLVGGPGAGKSALLVAMASAWLGQGVRVVANVRDRRPEDFAVRLSAITGGPSSRTDGGAVAAHLRSALPSFKLLMGSIEHAASELGTGPGVLMVDSLQAGLTTRPLRGDSEGANVEGVLRAANEARALGALVIATSEQTRGASGVGRHTAAIEHQADALIAMTPDDNGQRFHMQVRKPLGGVSRWLTLDASGKLLDVTAPERRAPATVKRRRADNAPARSEAEIAAAVAAFVREHPNASMRVAEREIEGRTDTIRAAYRAAKSGGVQ